jgi:hypothetical protein
MKRRLAHMISFEHPVEDIWVCQQILAVKVLKRQDSTKYLRRFLDTTSQSAINARACSFSDMVLAIYELAGESKKLVKKPLEIEAEGKALKVESSIAIIKVDELIKIYKILYQQPK